MKYFSEILERKELTIWFPGKWFKNELKIFQLSSFLKRLLGSHDISLKAWKKSKFKLKFSINEEYLYWNNNSSDQQ